MFRQPVYYNDEWDVKSWWRVRHTMDGYFAGYTAIILLRNKRTRRPKRIKVGNCCWKYDSAEELDEAIFAKTGAEVVDDSLRLAEL